MALVIEKPVASFDLSQIQRGYLLWGRHSTWNEGKAGFITSATESQLIVQYYPGVGNVTNHFIIPVSEVAESQWELRWSADMSEIQEHSILADNEHEREGTDDDSGRADS